jgi:DNA-binding winged helix-turn-helix (wHTH) protein/TolB-like protein/Flp pilus assembly protein TadD
MAVEIQKKYLLDDYELDAGRHSLVREGVPIPLSRKRFQVLLCLLEERHRLVSRHELLERFWDGHEVYEENLTKCISEIRKALADQKKPHRFIETVPAVGYRYIGSFAEATRQLEPSVFAVERTRGVRVVVEEDNERATPRDGEQVPATPVEDLGVLSKPARVRQSSRFVAVLSSCAVIASVAGAIFIYSHRAGLLKSNSAAATTGLAPIHSLAVLPFKPINAQKRNEYLELGMADALIAKLSNVKQLIVRPTSAIRNYNNIDQDPLAAGREQGVDAVLDASIQKLGDQVSVTVRLLRVADGSSLWTFRCADNCADVFAAQDSIAEQIAQAIKVSLSDEEKTRLAKHSTESKEAYQDYLRGRYYWNKKTPEELKKAIHFYQSAIDKDPTYALAYVGLSEAYNSQDIYDHEHAPQAIPRARAAALKALEIDDTLAAAHAALAPLKWIHDWDFAGGEREFKQAIALDPNYAETHHWYGLYLMERARHEEAVAEIKRAAELDPLSPMISTDVGLVLSFARKYDEAIAQFRETLEVAPNFFEAHHLLGQTYMFKGQFAEALGEYRKMSDGGVSNDYVKGELGYAYAKVGKLDEAHRILRELEEQANADDGVVVAETSFVYIGLGNKDEAFKLLNKLGARRDHWLRFLDTYPFLDDLRSDPRFSDLQRRVGLSQ